MIEIKEDYLSPLRQANRTKSNVMLTKHYFDFYPFFAEFPSATGCALA